MASNCAHVESRYRPGSEPRLRPAAPGDAPAIHVLVDSIFREYDLRLVLDGPDAHLCEPGGFCRSRGGEFWVLDRDGELVGTVGVVLCGDDSAELKSLYVHPSIRNLGWGAKLTTLVMDFARQAGKRHIFLWSDTRFPDAHRLYRRLGFAQKGERDLHDDYQSREYGFSLNFDSLRRADAV